MGHLMALVVGARSEAFAAVLTSKRLLSGVRANMFGQVARETGAVATVLETE